MFLRALVCVLALVVVTPLAAIAKPVATLDGGTVLFFNGALAIVVRNGVTLHLSDGIVATAATAYIDLRADRAVLAGNAQLTRGTTTLHADAFGFDLSAHKIDLLRSESGITQTDAHLAEPLPAPADGDALVFPDLADSGAYIRARHADIVSRTSVRFRPAAFPTSTGAPPVPMYLYTFAAGNGYAATALSGAAFDQPYGLFSSPNALTSLHFRYLNGIGPSLGIEQNIIGGNDGYLAGGVEVPFHSAIDESLNGYQQIGQNGTVSLGAATDDGYHEATLGFTQAIGTLVSRLNYGITNQGYSSALLSLRTRDKELFDGITWHTSISYGFVAQDGGVLPLAPDPTLDQTIWQKGIDIFVASPLMHLPLRTTLAATIDASRTAYSYPETYNALEADITGSRKLDRFFTLFFGYDVRWSADIFPNAQQIFYPPTLTPYFYLGYTTGRLANINLQYVQGPYTSILLSYQHADDFPQVNNYIGRPPNAVSMNLRIRPFPNIGISFGRSYDFGWDNSRWVPGWSLSIFQ